MTVSGKLASPLRTSVNTAVAPSVNSGRSADTVTRGRSSSTITAIAVQLGSPPASIAFAGSSLSVAIAVQLGPPPSSTALVGSLRERRNISGTSGAVSSATATVIVRSLTPGANVNLPAAAV